MKHAQVEVVARLRADWFELVAEARLCALDVAVTVTGRGMICLMRPYTDGDLQGLLRRISEARRRLREGQG
jgi:hypothetical protein